MPVDPELERKIAEHLAAGEVEAAATAALTGLGPQILGYLAATMRDDDAAYDVFGQFSEELWKSIRTFRAESSFKTWAYKLVMHAVSRYLRDGYRRHGQPLEISQLDEVAAQVRSQTPPFKKTEVKDRVAQLRATLDPEDQTLLFLRIDQQLSWNDVAEVMSERGERVETAALRKRFERAKAQLRKVAEDEGLIGD